MKRIVSLILIAIVTVSMIPNFVYASVSEEQSCPRCYGKGFTYGDGYDHVTTVMDWATPEHITKCLHVKNVMVAVSNV